MKTSIQNSLISKRFVSQNMTEINQRKETPSSTGDEHPFFNFKTF